MFTVRLDQVSKKYRNEWIFKDISFDFSLEKHAILGHNGSGKSTLVKILTGHLSPTKGRLTYTFDNQTIENDAKYKYVSIAAPYIELIEEFTLEELLVFHHQLKPFRKDVSIKELPDLFHLKSALNKEVRHFSSGMKQRLKLGLAICSDSPLLILDEPTTNLDTFGSNWYLEMIQKFGNNRIVIVASNTPEDYSFCNSQLSITDYKTNY